MKKLLSICFLSILFSFAGFVARAQEQSCCFWLENMQADTLHGIANMPDGTLVLDNVLDTARVGNTDTYRVRFCNSCGLSEETRVALEWELFEDGRPVNGNLSEYCDFKILTHYGRLGNVNGGYVGGTVKDGEGLFNTEAHTAGYPGAMSTLWGQNGHANTGYANFGNDYINLNYFNLPFFENNETKIVITWKQAGLYSLKVTLRQCNGGTEYPTLYWDESQQQLVGGHSAICGPVIASDSIHYLIRNTVTKEICVNSELPFGRPVWNFSGDVQNEEDSLYQVVFGETVCNRTEGETFITDTLTDLHLFYRRNPAVVVDKRYLEICQNDGDNLNFDIVARCVRKDTVKAYGLDADSEDAAVICWSADGEKFYNSYDSLKFNTDTGNHVYYVRQTNKYSNFGEEVICDGTPDSITVRVLPIFKPEVNEGMKTMYACSGGTVNLDDAISKVEGYNYFWADNKDSLATAAKEHLEAVLTVDKDTTATYYVYGSYKECFDVDSFSTVDVKFYALPKVEITQDPSLVCQKTEVTVKATELDNTEYTWGNGKTGNEITFTVDSAADYKLPVLVEEKHLVEGKNVATCSHHDTTTVKVNPMPEKPTVIGKDRFDFCLSENTSHVLDSLKPGANGTDCIWYLNGMPVDTTDAYTVANMFGELKNRDTLFSYKVVSYNDSTHCTTSGDSTEVEVHFHATPNVKLTKTIDDIICPKDGNVEISADVETPNCDNKEVTYLWIVDDDTNKAAVGEEVNVKVTIDDCNKEHKIVLEATNHYGCKNSDAISFSVKDTVAPKITNKEEFKQENDTVESVHAANCQYLVPDFTDKIEATDDCSVTESIKITQKPAAGDQMHESGPVTVYATDHCGNKDSVTVFVTVPEKQLEVKITANNDSFCFGGKTMLTANDLNCDTTVQYFWNGQITGGKHSIEVTPDESGQVPYFVKIVDVFGCEAFDTITLTVHPLPTADDITFKNVNNTYCYNEEGKYDGQIKVETLKEGFQYRRSGDESWHNASYDGYKDLYQGDYTIDLKSDKGCESQEVATTKVEVDTSFIEADIDTVSNHACKAELYDGQIIVKNPQEGHIYTLEGSDKKFVEDEDGETLVIGGLAKGTYTVEQVTDKHCKYTGQAVVTDNLTYPGFDWEDATVQDLTDCANDNGALIIHEKLVNDTYTFGGMTITYTEDKDEEFKSFFSGLGAFRDTLFVTTPLGCTDKNVYTIQDKRKEFDVPVCTPSPNKNCKEEKGGSITVEDPMEGYTYKLEKSTGEVVKTIEMGGSVTQVVFDGLDSGTYTLHFTTDLHCDSTVPGIRVKNEVEKVVKPLLDPENDNYCVGSNGKITVTNHNPAYKYTLEGYDDVTLENNAFTGLAGNKTYTVKASNEETGCFAVSEAVTIDSITDSYTIEHTEEANTGCTPEKLNGEVTITVEGQDIAAFTYSFNKGEFGTENVFGELDTGEYVVKAKNRQTGCVYTDTAKVTENIERPVVAVTHTDNTICVGEMNGTITVTLPQNTDEYDYTFKLNESELSNANFSDYTLSKLGPGNYTVVVTEKETGCETTKDVEVDSKSEGTPKITVNTTDDKFDFCKGADIKLTATAKNEVEGDQFTYKWFKVGSEDDTTRSNECKPSTEVAGEFTYNVIVTSELTNCVANQSVEVKVHHPVIAFTKDEEEVSGTPAACGNEAVVIAVSKEDYTTYSWSTPVGDKPDRELTLAANEWQAGKYKVTVTDEYGCSNEDSLELTLNKSYDTTVNESHCVGENGEYVFKKNIGDGNTEDTTLTFVNEWSDDPDWNVFTVVENLKTVNGCDSVVKHVITLQKKPTISITNKDELQEGHCEKDILDIEYTVNFNNNNKDNADTAWYIGDLNAVFDPKAQLTNEMDGKVVYLKVTNGCDPEDPAIDSFKLEVIPAPTVEPLVSDGDTVVCDGEDFLQAPEYNANGKTDHHGWQWSIDNVDFQNIDAPANFNYDDHNGKYFRYNVKACGDTSTQSVLVHVNKPITATAADTFSTCKGTSVDIDNFSITYTVKTDSVFKTVLQVKNGENFEDVELPHSFSEPGDYKGMFKFDLCGESFTNEFAIKVTDKPAIDDIVKGEGEEDEFTFCLNKENYNDLKMPKVNHNGKALTDSAWEIKHGDGEWTELDANLTIENHGDSIRFWAKNECGENWSNAVVLTLSNEPEIDGEIDAVNDTLKFCEGEEFNLTKLNTKHDDIVNIDSFKYEYRTTGGTWTKIENATPITKDMDKAELHYCVFNDCGSDTTKEVTIKVTDTAHLEVALANTNSDLCRNETAETFTVKYKIDNELTKPKVVNDPEGKVTINQTGSETEVESGIVTTTYQLSYGDATIGSYAIAVAVKGCGETTKADTLRFTLSDKPKVTITYADASQQTLDAVCSGQWIKPQFNIDTNSAKADKKLNEYFGWETKGNAEWKDSIKSLYEYNDDMAWIAAENHCGSDTAKFVVKVDTLYIDSALTATDTMICNTNAELKMPVKSNVGIEVAGLTFEPAKADATYTLPECSFADNTVKFTGMTQLPNGTLTGFYTTKLESEESNACAPDTTEFKIKVNAIPVISWHNVYKDTVCKGNPFNLPELDTAYNTYDTNSVSKVYFLADGAKTDTFKNYETTEADTNHDLKYVYVVLSNGCGKDTTHKIVLHVAGGFEVKAPVVKRNCQGSPLRDFIEVVPSFDPIGSDSAIAEGYQVRLTTDEGVWADKDSNEAISDDSLWVRYYVSNRCDTSFYSDSVKLKVNHKPAFTDATPKVDLAGCHNSELTFEGLRDSVPNLNDPDTVITDTVWVITKGEFEFTLNSGGKFTLDTSYNGATVKCLVRNGCGTDTATGTLTVHALPTPKTDEYKAICKGVELELTPKDVQEKSVYSWHLSDPDTTIKGADFSFKFEAESYPNDVNYIDLILTEKDSNGCAGEFKSKVRVSDNPEFIFRNTEGKRITQEEINTGEELSYTVNFDLHCTKWDTMVYLEVRLYHDNDLLLYGNAPTGNHIDSFMNHIAIDQEKFWYVKNKIEWMTAETTPQPRSDSSYYGNTDVSGINVPGGFHYPNSHIGASNPHLLYDELYLHFLYDRPITETVAPFRREGKYKIVYTLRSTSFEDPFGYKYYNDSIPEGHEGHDLKIGGHNFNNGDTKELATDSLVIIVSGEDVAASSAPQAPMAMTPATGAPAMKIYPNPAHESIQVSITGMEGPATIRIADLSGKRIDEQQLQIPAGMLYTHKQSVTGYVPGVYLVTVKDGNAVVTRKLVITK